ncbi:MAG: DUF4058 family protein [Gemmataceae bacterium]|nr:DUF4058 family protein [Gemmataceae bacterium]
MPVHNWTLVDAGIFHDFHCSWIVHLKESLNDGVLPEGYYALAEQKAHIVIPDVITLERRGAQFDDRKSPSGRALAETPPRVKLTLRPSEMAAYRARQRVMTIRHVSGDEIVALLEVVSPANKDRRASVRDFVQKAVSAMKQGIHHLILDLLPPGEHDPSGMHGAIWDDLNAGDYAIADDKPLALTSYAVDQLPDAYVEPLAVGDALPEMPLFLEPDRYVNVPLETTYQNAFRGLPEHLRERLQQPSDVLKRDNSGGKLP